ncbi:MAG: DeoR family transcriptional regulator [Bacteroidota bacterium]|jgi:predicted HTH transcriptional regulator|nr:DeoR family transcriptional regulator [Bacteroidota bacterium]
MAAKREQYVALMDPKARIERDPVISARQKKALKHVMTSGEISSRTYAELTGLSDATARRDLFELVLGGWLRHDGAGRTSLWLPGDLLYPGGGEQRVPSADGSGDGCFNCG